MDKATLVDFDAETGRKVLEALDADGFNVRAAFWYYFTDSAEWRFIVATPSMEKAGPHETYTKIGKILREKDLLKEVPLRKIVALSPKDPLIQLLRLAVKTGPGISGIWFSNNVVNGNAINDAYIYRIQ